MRVKIVYTFQYKLFIITKLFSVILSSSKSSISSSSILIPSSEQSEANTVWNNAFLENEKKLQIFSNQNSIYSNQQENLEDGNKTQSVSSDQQLAFDSLMTYNQYYNAHNSKNNLNQQNNYHYSISSNQQENLMNVNKNLSVSSDQQPTDKSLMTYNQYYNAHNAKVNSNHLNNSQYSSLSNQQENFIDENKNQFMSSGHQFPVSSEYIQNSVGTLNHNFQNSNNQNDYRCSTSSNQQENFSLGSNDQFLTSGQQLTDDNIMNSNQYSNPQNSNYLNNYQYSKQQCMYQSANSANQTQNITLENKDQFVSSNQQFVSSNQQFVSSNQQFVADTYMPSNQDSNLKNSVGISNHDMQNTNFQNYHQNSTSTNQQENFSLGNKDQFALSGHQFFTENILTSNQPPDYNFNDPQNCISSQLNNLGGNNFNNVGNNNLLKKTGFVDDNTKETENYHKKITYPTNINNNSHEFQKTQTATVKADFQLKFNIQCSSKNEGNNQDKFIEKSSYDQQFTPSRHPQILNTNVTNNTLDQSFHNYGQLNLDEITSNKHQFADFNQLQHYESNCTLTAQNQANHNTGTDLYQGLFSSETCKKDSRNYQVNNSNYATATLKQINQDYIGFGHQDTSLSKSELTDNRYFQYPNYSLPQFNTLSDNQAKLPNAPVKTDSNVYLSNPVPPLNKLCNNQANLSNALVKHDSCQLPRQNTNDSFIQSNRLAPLYGTGLNQVLSSNVPEFSESTNIQVSNLNYASTVQNSQHNYQYLSPNKSYNTLNIKDCSQSQTKFQVHNPCPSLSTTKPKIFKNIYKIPTIVDKNIQKLETASSIHNLSINEDDLLNNWVLNKKSEGINMDYKLNGSKMKTKEKQGLGKFMDQFQIQSDKLQDHDRTFKSNISNTKQKKIINQTDNPTSTKLHEKNPDNDIKSEIINRSFEKINNSQSDYNKTSCPSFLNIQSGYRFLPDSITLTNEGKKITKKGETTNKILRSTKNKQFDSKIIYKNGRRFNFLNPAKNMRQSNLKKYNKIVSSLHRDSKSEKPDKQNNLRDENPINLIIHARYLHESTDEKKNSDEINLSKLLCNQPDSLFANQPLNLTLPKKFLKKDTQICTKISQALDTEKIDIKSQNEETLHNYEENKPQNKPEKNINKSNSERENINFKDSISGKSREIIRKSDDKIYQKDSFAGSDSSIDYALDPNDTASCNEIEYKGIKLAKIILKGKKSNKTKYSQKSFNDSKRELKEEAEYTGCFAFDEENVLSKEATKNSTKRSKLDRPKIKKNVSNTININRRRSERLKKKQDNEGKIQFSKKMCEDKKIKTIVQKDAEHIPTNEESMTFLLLDSLLKKD